jgi:molybdate transport system substrate-binding protein
MSFCSALIAGSILMALLAGCAGTDVTPSAMPPVTPSDTPLPDAQAAAAIAATALALPAKAPGGVTLNVFAAASLQDAFGEIGRNFQAANPDAQVAFNFAGSQQLAQQISQGAPADVFASANQAQLNVAIQAKRVASGAGATFARNRLVVVLPKDNPAKLQTLQDLGKPGLKIVLAAKEVPAGQYALDFLDKAVKDAAYGAGYKDTVLKNVMSYEDSVRAVLSKVALGEADAGIVYTTDVSPATADKVARIDIPDALNTIAVYPIAVLLDSPHPDLAKKFVDYVLSDAGQKVLAAYGFIPANTQ